MSVCADVVNYSPKKTRKKNRNIPEECEAQIDSTQMHFYPQNIYSKRYLKGSKITAVRAKTRE